MAPLPPLALNAWLRYDAIRRAFAVIPAGARVLEIGAGQGSVGARLARRFDYTGVEPDHDSAQVARHRIELSGGRFLAIPADELSLDERFHVVCAFEVLEHIEDDAATLLKWVGRVRPGGWLILSVPAFQYRFAAWDSRAGHYRRYDPEVLHQRLTDAGLHEVDQWVTGFPLGIGLENARNFIARIERPGHPSLDARSSASGRAYQPPPILGLVTQLASLPFRYLQRPFARTRLGTGLVARGQKLQ